MIHSTSIKKTIFGNDVTAILTTIWDNDIAQRVSIDGGTLLHLSAMTGNVEISRHILNIYPNAIYVMATDNRPAVFDTVYCNNNLNIEVFNLLYTDRTVNHSDSYGKTMLHMIANNNNLDICFFKLVLDKMKPEFINAITRDSETALHVASQNDRIELCRLLLLKMNKESVIIKNYDNKTAYDMTSSPTIKLMIKTFVEGNSDDTILVTPYEEPNMCVLF